MAKNSTLFLTQSGNLSESVLGVAGTAFTPGAEGAKLLMLKVSAIGTTPSGGTILVGGVTIYTFPGAITAGTDILAAITALPTDKNSNPYLNIESGDVVTFVGVTGGTIQIAAYGEDY